MADLPDEVSPFMDKINFITCRKGCNKQILTKQEFMTHNCIDHLKNVIRDQELEKEMLYKHLREAKSDIKDLLTEFKRCKESQESVIDELKEELTFLEKRNKEIHNKRILHNGYGNQEYEDEQVQNEQESTLAFMNFIQTAEKDFTTFTQRLDKNYSKYHHLVEDKKGQSPLPKPLLKPSLTTWQSYNDRRNMKKSMSTIATTPKPQRKMKKLTSYA